MQACHIACDNLYDVLFYVSLLSLTNLVAANGQCEKALSPLVIAFCTLSHYFCDNKINQKTESYALILSTGNKDRLR